MRSFTKKLRTADRGQAIILIALAMVGLVAFVGLMTDGGILLIEYGKLKRGIDSAAIAASQQFRRGFTGADLSAAARNFLILNESDSANINIYRCIDVEPPASPVSNGTLHTDGTIQDTDLCTTPRRKLVRVEATRTVQFGFLRVVGLNSWDISASSVGEAASIDLVLVIDTSTSMSYETGGSPNSPDSALDDPSVCNYSTTNPCQPLSDVKDVADQFMNTMYFPYDRVAVVTITGQTASGTRDHVTVLQLSDSETTVRAAIASLKVFEPPACNWATSPASPAFGPCLNYDAGGSFLGLDCPLFRDTGDPSSCNSSNIGGALLRAAGEYGVNPVRVDSLWITILLAGGPANATDSPSSSLLYGFCPPATWSSPTNPYCRDADADTWRTSTLDPDYDADDYARNQAEFVANPVTGQGVTVFTIGLGNLIQNAPKGDADAGEKLLEYIAETAGGTTANHGFYSYAPSTADLDDIFDAIAENIVTRIAR